MLAADMRCRRQRLEAWSLRPFGIWANSSGLADHDPTSASHLFPMIDELRTAPLICRECAAVALVVSNRASETVIAFGQLTA